MSHPDRLHSAEANTHLALGLIACLDTMHELMAEADWSRQKDDLGALIGEIRTRVAAARRDILTLSAVRNCANVENLR